MDRAGNKFLVIKEKEQGDYDLYLVRMKYPALKGEVFCRIFYKYQLKLFFDLELQE